eukprot:scaffold3456_cov112-Cylindrotheca_fusiformis.AAC.5
MTTCSTRMPSVEEVSTGWKFTGACGFMKRCHLHYMDSANEARGSWFLIAACLDSFVEMVTPPETPYVVVSISAF